jgi:hypothetical protein
MAGLACGLATAALAGGPPYTYDYENRVPFAWNVDSWPQRQVPVTRPGLAGNPYQ